jgi:hypothetical protein
MQVRCLIQRYDPKVKEAPFTFINLGEFWIEETEDNTDGGIKRRNQMWDACNVAGFDFKFYSMCSDDPRYKYSVTVR